tara:strand:+ start:185 stop:385 length:201 start_codon:yes stop_codon:yes gene_type:complete
MVFHIWTTKCLYTKPAPLNMVAMPVIHKAAGKFLGVTPVDRGLSAQNNQLINAALSEIFDQNLHAN